ncbi:MAG: DUF6807 family protein [Phycisphaeraceae bacterium]
MKKAKQVLSLGLLPVLALVLLLCQASTSQAQTATGDHILLITIDDLNDWIGCLTDKDAPAEDGHLTGQGHPQASTPNLDRLAKRGVLFTNAHCQAPICKPSRTSFMSGLRPTTSGIYANRSQYDAKGSLTPGKDLPWMTKRFEQAGYDVYTAGKLLHASRNQPLGGTPCFKTGQGPYPPKKLIVPPDVAKPSIWDIGVYPETEERYTDLRIAKWTAGNIAKPMQPDSKPRFMALGFYNPHLPLFAPQKWYDAAPSKADVLLHATQAGDMDDLSPIAKRIATRVSFKAAAGWSMSTEDNLRTLTQAYLACTSAMDGALGEVIDALDQSDMADNTWIVVLSDHGWHLGEKNHVAKQTLWTRSTRVPLIIVPPKRMKDTPRGVRCDRPAELLDVYPTLVDAVDLKTTEADKHLDGLSLLPWLADPAAEKDRPAITTIYAHNHSLVDTRYRYTRYADGSEELYDRSIDPHEFDNLIEQAKSDEALQTVIKRLSKHLPKDEAGKPDFVDDRVPAEPKKKRSLLDGERTLLDYNAAFVPSPIEDVPGYGRSGFIHPVYSPSGRVVTDAFPDDHPHQHAIMFAWTSATYQGQKVDFWNSHKKQGKIEHVKTRHADDDTIQVELRHVITAGKHNNTTVLHETWTLTRVPHDTLNVFDLLSVQTCATDKPLTIRKYKYGGLCVRGPAAWSNTDAMLTSEGKTQQTGNHTRPHWVALFGQARKPGDEKTSTAGIAAMSHPDNHHGPQPVRLHEKFSYFCFAPMVAGQFQITPDKPYTSRFRFVAFDGQPDPDTLNALWQDYTQPLDER